MTPEHLEAEATYHRSIARAAQERADTLRRIDGEGQADAVAPDVPEWMFNGSLVRTRDGKCATIGAHCRVSGFLVWLDDGGVYAVHENGMRRCDGVECQTDVVGPWVDEPPKPEPVRLHVGYVGMTRDGDRVWIYNTKRSASKKPLLGDNGHDYRTDGRRSENLPSHPTDIIAPWSDDPEERARIMAGVEG